MNSNGYSNLDFPTLWIEEVEARNFPFLAILLTQAAIDNNQTRCLWLCKRDLQRCKQCINNKPC